MNQWLIKKLLACMCVCSVVWLSPAHAQLGMPSFPNGFTVDQTVRELEGRIQQGDRAATTELAGIYLMFGEREATNKLLQPLMDKPDEHMAQVYILKSIIAKSSSATRQETPEPIEWMARAKSELERDSAGGDGGASEQLARFYMYGEYQAFPKSSKNREHYHQLALKQGDAGAQYNEAREAMYQARELYGDKKDQKKQAQYYRTAAYWLEKSAQKKVAQAAYDLAGLYSQGYGVVKDLPKALYWYREAAISFHDYAPVYISRMYLAGEGAERNYPLSYAWARIARNYKSPEAEDTESDEIIKELKPLMSAEQIAQGEAIYQKWEKERLWPQ